MRKLLLGILLYLPVIMMGQNWDYIRDSGEYYYGVGRGTNEVEASERAMADLVSMIATNVSKEFQYLMDEQNSNGKLEHQSKVLSCIKTYSTSTLTNVEKWVIGKEPDVTVRRYIRRSEMAKIYEDREAKARDMVKIADEALGKGKIDMALQYYYWAYSLIRSVQRPNMVRDGEGNVLVNWLPMKIDDILSKVAVSFEKREGDNVDLLFAYDGVPISSLDFSYSDGRTECQGTAKDGRGMIEMVPGYETDMYHISIEYEYKGQARGDAEMQSVLDVISLYVWGDATSVSENYDGGKMQALELARANLVSSIESYITKIVESNRANKQLDAGQAATVIKTLSESKSFVSQRLGQTIPVVEVYRDQPNGNKEVRVMIFYSMGTARKIAREAIRQQLEEEGHAISDEELDKMMGGE